MSILNTKNKLAYPGTLPGFDPTHPCVIGAEMPFSALAMAGTFIELSGNRASSASGAPTSFGIEGTVGPSATYQSSALTQFATQFPGVVWSVGTLAAIFLTGSAVGSGGYGAIVGQTNGNSFLLANWSGNGKLEIAQPQGGTDTNSGLAVSANTPYFAAASYNSSIVNFVLVNLQTGQIESSSVALATTWNAGTSGFVYIGNDPNANTSLGGSISAIAVMNGFLPLQSLQEWAQDPWSFWYPTQFDIIDMLRTAGGSGAYSLSVSQGTYSLTGESQNLNVGRIMSTTEGTYSQIGYTSSLNVGMPASQGSYSLSGQTVGLGENLPIVQGSYSVAGESVTFGVKLSELVNQGNYSLSGYPQVLEMVKAGTGSGSGHRFANVDIGNMASSING